MVVKVTAALVSTLTKFASEKLFTAIHTRYEKWKSVDGDIRFIKTELGMIVATLESQFLQGVHPNGVHEVAMNTLRDLAYDIEDCFDRFLLCTSCEGQDLPFLSNFPSEIQGLKKRLMEARKQIIQYASIDHGKPTAEVSASTRAPLPKVNKPLGIDKPKQELVDLLLAMDVEGQQAQPRVISIVGFGGSGKTRLARELYGCGDVVREFPTRAWVDASKYKNDYKGLLLALLKKLRRRLQGEDTVDSEVEELQDEISQYLNAVR